MSESFLPLLFATFEDIDPLEISLKGSAEQMGITEGTLRSQLRRLGMHFQYCKDIKQQALFAEGFASGLRSDDLAAHCGYLEKNSLFRAIPRWYGYGYTEYAAKAA